MWDVLFGVLGWSLYLMVLVIAAVSLVGLPALLVSSWVQRRRTRTADC